MTLAGGLVIGGGQGQVGTGQVAVPDVVGKTQAEAEADLRALGLTLRVQEVESNTPPGTVILQNPAPFTIRSRGSVVTIVIGRAPVVPPDLGQQLEDLKTAVDGVGAKVDAVTTAVDGVGTKVDEVATAVGAVDAKLDDLGTAVANVETDEAAATRQQEILDKLDGAAGGGE
jgi:beta-lactam-binding protein with PASTA domain